MLIGHVRREAGCAYGVHERPLKLFDSTIGRGGTDDWIPPRESHRGPLAVASIPLWMLLVLPLVRIAATPLSIGSA